MILGNVLLVNLKMCFVIASKNTSASKDAGISHTAGSSQPADHDQGMEMESLHQSGE